LGGTKTEVVVVHGDEEGLTIDLRKRISTPRDDGYEAIVAATAELALTAAREAGVDVAATPIGVGMPGHVTRRSGVVKNSNTVCLNGRPFREDLARAVGRPIAFENDANCFALAEALHGAAKEHKGGVVFGVILGTGVGGGLVLRGQVWGGPQGIAGEWG